jgi:hypothetical protein
MKHLQSKQLLIYIDSPSERLEYIFKIVLNNACGLSFKLTTDLTVFNTSSLAGFSYAKNKPFSHKPHLSSHGLLNENKVREIDIDVFEIDGAKVFFSSCNHSFFPFDIFAASFYLITRYEEYLPFVPDKYGRFPANASLAYRHDFLDQPLINIWTDNLCNQLCQIFPNLLPIRRKFQFLSTIDIDNAWAHLHKGFVRTLLSFLKSFIKLDLKSIWQKTKVVFFNFSDPYDTYTYIKQIHTKFGYRPIYFILFSAYSKYDKNPSPKNRHFKNLIKSLAATNDIGLHPSFLSNSSKNILINEKTLLEKELGKKLFISRQHYLMLKLPETYLNLIDAGIVIDLSMGYSSHVGFRASFCLPFLFFDLTTNKETNLMVVPFSFMDVCFRDNQKKGGENALMEIKKIISSIKKVNGLFVSIWHNETLSKLKKSTDWRRIFEEMMQQTQNENSIH